MNRIKKSPHSIIGKINFYEYLSNSKIPSMTFIEYLKQKSKPNEQKDEKD